jgi:3-hydroxyisobutyrate dehydrogenase-like beta-hydroxyacid dehydrogenase
MSQQQREATVGFIGLGAMGQPMALNIVKSGQSLLMYDIAEQRYAPLAALGAKAVGTPSDVARGASVVVSMVDTTAQNEEVIFGAEGIAQAAQPGDVIVIMSTIDPVEARSFAERLAAQGVSLIESPVTGMIEGAEKGILKAYVGGEASALDKARPVLESMTSNILHVGDIGLGSTFKLINNMLAQANRVLVVEALVLAAKAGIDLQLMIDTVSASTGNSVIFQHAAPRLLSRDFTGIRMDITIKDLELQTQIAKSLGVPLFMANTAQQVYMMGKAAGYGGEDPAAVVKVYEQLLGISLARP